MTDDSPAIISIFGNYAPKAGERAYEEAYAIGHALGAAGYVVCNGGYDGIMEASAKGARDAGGETVGVTCSVFNDYRGIPLKANRWIDREICQDNIFTRIQCMMEMSAGFVTLEGGTGTLTELAIVWEYVAKGLMPPRPIVIYGDFWAPLVDRLVFARPKSGKHIHRADTPEQVAAIFQEHVPRTGESD